MYTVDDRDRVEELTEVPQSSIGATLPTVVADEHDVFLAYLVEAHDPNWKGQTVRKVGPGSADEIVALVTFVRAYAHQFGPPSDESFAGHPLATRRLHPYGVFEVLESSWVRQLERMNSVHPYHRRAAFDGRRHFVFAFHDSTFECVAESFNVEVCGGSLAAAVVQLSGRLRDAAK